MPRHLFSVVYNLTAKNVVQKSGIINSLLDVLECSVPEYFYSTTRKNTYGLLTKRKVKMAGYWPSSFFAFLWTETKSRSINTQKKNEANIQPS